MIKIYDDFLNDKSLLHIQNIFFSPKFSWLWCDNIVHPPQCDELDDYQFYRILYGDGFENEKVLEDLTPILKHSKINCRYVIRIKANCNPRSDRIIKQGFHIDTSVKCTTAIFYVNSNDGYTEFEDGTRVESIANRFVTFPSHLLHTGTSCTNQKRRVVINLNYYDPYYDETEETTKGS